MRSTYLSALCAASACVVAFPVHAGPQADEVRAIAARIAQTHPDGARLARDETWLTAVEDLAGRADNLAPDALVVEELELLARIGDGHTSVFVPEFNGGVFGQALPMVGRAFHDGYYIVEAGGEAADLLGARVVSINGVPIESLMTQFVAALPRDNDAWGHALSSFIVRSMGGLMVAGAYRDGPVTLVAERDGTVLTATVTPSRQAIADLGTLEGGRDPWTRMRGETGGSMNFAKVEDGTLFIRLDAMEDVEGRTFLELTRQVAASLADAAVERVVLDLRNNNGGNNFMGEPLRRHLIASRFNRPGGIFILTGPQTFSAAQNFVTRMERDSYAVFVGEPTGGSPNHAGDAQPLEGGATGATTLISTRRWQDMPPMDERIWIMPDLPAPMTYADWKAGRDPALEVIAAASEIPAPDLRLIGAPWRRPSQQADWRPFWRAGD